MTSTAKKIASDKIRATVAAQRKIFDAQNIVVDANWTIQRADALNWEIRYQGKLHGYYGDLAAALHALPAKMLDAHAQNSLDNAIQSLAAIHAAINETLKWKLPDLSPPV